MKKGRYQKNASICITKTTLAMFVLVAVLLILVFLLLKGCDTVIPVRTETVEKAVEKNPNSIAIPGYEGLELIADKRKQTLCLPNPAQNACYFQISLFLEDGTLLWESELIEPGELSKPIKLSMTLEKGSYPNSVLHYACFAMDGSMTPLNGAEMKLTLRVK